MEVYFPRYGWVTFNPTPDRDGGGAGGIGTGSGDFDAFPETGIEFFDPLDALGSGSLDIDANPITDALSEEPQIAGDPLVPMWAWYVLMGMAGVAVLGLVSGRVAWNWGLGGLEGRVRLWAKAQRAASWAGLGSSRDETPREWSSRLGSAIGREPDALTLARAYEEARYGRPEASQLDDAEIDSAYKRLRKTLMRVILRRQKPGALDAKK